MKLKTALERKIVGVVSLMIVALVGILFVQYYWIHNAINENRSHFRQKVYDVLDNVAMRIERHESMTYAFGTISPPAEWLADTVRVHLRNSNRAFFTNKSDYSFYFKLDGIDISSPQGRRFEIHAPQLSEEEAHKIIDNYNKEYKFLFNKLLLARKPLESRLSYFLVDSLIASEFRNKGINTNYEFGVLDRLNHKIIYADKVKDKKRLIDSGFNTELFRNDLFGSHSSLYLYLPDESGYLIGQMSVVLLASALFIGIIIFSFAIAIFMVLRQKKISEVTNDFINNMTHEFKTPISTISLACEVMQDPDVQQMPSQVQRYIKIIRDECGRLSKQVEKVLQTARLDKGDIRFNIQKVDIQDTIINAASNIHLQVENKGGHIEMQLDAQECICEGDELHLFNVISNLLDNANKYSPETPEILIQTESLRKGIKISVTDNGLGISKADIDKIFDKFYRVPTGNVHDVKGFGLGLSYVRTIIEAHHGSITVKSELGKGSTFCVFIPYDYHKEPNES